MDEVASHSAGVRNSLRGPGCCSIVERAYVGFLPCNCTHSLEIQAMFLHTYAVSFGQSHVPEGSRPKVPLAKNIHHSTAGLAP